MKKSSKGSKSVKKQPFAKRESSIALGLIVGLTVFNLLYSYAVGLPLPRAVVSSYVESIYELGDKQVEAYNMMGAGVYTTAKTAVALVSWPKAEETHVASPVYATEAQYSEAETPAPEPLLLIAPNQISIAK